MHWLCCFEPLSVCVLVFRASSDAPAANIRKCSSKALDMLSRQIHCHCCLLDHHHCLLHHSHPHDLISLNAIMCNLRTIIMASISVATMFMPVGCLQMEWAPAGRAAHPLRALKPPSRPKTSRGRPQTASDIPSLSLSGQTDTEASHHGARPSSSANEALAVISPESRSGEGTPSRSLSFRAGALSQDISRDADRDSSLSTGPDHLSATPAQGAPSSNGTPATRNDQEGGLQPLQTPPDAANPGRDTMGGTRGKQGSLRKGRSGTSPSKAGSHRPRTPADAAGATPSAASRKPAAKDMEAGRLSKHSRKPSGDGTCAQFVHRKAGASRAASPGSLSDGWADIW